MKRIDDLITSISNTNQVYFTFEFFPPKTIDGLQNLQTRIQRMIKLNPSMIHFTWGPNGSTFKSSLELAHFVQIQLGFPTCLHLTCTNLSIDLLNQALNEAQRLGIVNILALRGDPPRPNEYTTDLTTNPTTFNHAIDLVKYINSNYPNTFCLGVAGYPEGSIDVDPKEELFFLKEKVEAGAQFIVSQLFYDTSTFLNWVKECRQIGIKVPIIPSIMPIQSYESFRRLTSLTKIKVPQSILDSLSPIQTNDQAVKDFGLKLSLQTIQTLRSHQINSFHLCTLNLELTITRLLQALNWSNPMTTSTTTLLHPGDTSRVLPILQPGLEPNTWDDFPNGRFGDSRSPAYGKIDQYYGGIGTLSCDFKIALKKWGSPKTETDLTNLFVRYTKGEIDSTPWSDTPLLEESNLISDTILKLNLNGYWTISSQPTIDGYPSDNPFVGFGPKGGYVYQKSFVEFFCSFEQLEILRLAIEIENSKTEVGMLKYYAGKRNEEIIKSNVAPGETNVVTWGVFRSAEVVTTTIIELTSFKNWKDEAFEIWSSWESCFQSEPKTKTKSLLNSIGNEKWLCTIIDHDFKSGEKLWKFLELNCI
ncbi:methylenetetrahydrofolate reductase-domain-containing protein [Melampsora americana]|nr:methylenetetrahydrofolate reductase-domain-containing protein [Melampsora americana]